MHLTKLKGQGLIEILITLFIIAGSVIALLRFQSYLAYTASLANQQATAAQLAISQIETLRDYSALTGTGSYANIASGTSSVTGTTATFSLSWTVTASTNPTYKTIALTVSWTDIRGTAQSRQYVTRIASIDPAFSSTVMTM